MQRIVPNLWFDGQAAKAAELYLEAFKDGRVLTKVEFKDTPSGDASTVSLALSGFELVLLDGGPYFKINPSVSFLVARDEAAAVDDLVARLGEGGGVMMPLGSYDFSPRYAWIIDRFGVSWQVMLPPEGMELSGIRPVQMFTGSVCGKAEEAVRFYASVFPGSAVGEVARYGPDESPDAEGTAKFAGFTLFGREFAAMDSAYGYGFSFNEAASYIIRCDSQEEVDRYWAALSFDPSAEQCGWVKDRYGFSWQIVPLALERLLGDSDQARKDRVVKAMLGMKKLSIAGLEEAAGRRGD